MAGPVASRYNGNLLDSPPVHVISSPTARPARLVFALKQYTQGQKPRVYARSLIEVSFFIGRELILRRWKCTFTDRGQASQEKAGAAGWAGEDGRKNDGPERNVEFVRSSSLALMVLQLSNGRVCSGFHVELLVNGL